MIFSMITTDIDYIQSIYQKFPKDIATLEVTANNTIYTNPSWKEMLELHKEYNKLKVTYSLGK